MTSAAFRRPCGGKKLSGPDVSVIIPVYNVEKYLRQCLDSVTGQTLENIEIICVDDGSDDSSPRILEEYAAKDSRIKVLTQKNAGAGAARNKGLAAAKGRYLSFLDSDDFFEADMLECAYEKITQDAADFVVFQSDQYYTDDDKYKEMPWTLRVKEIPPYTPFSHRQMTDNIFKVFVGWAWDKLYDREFVIKNNLLFQEQRTSNDMLFVFSAVFLAKRITVVKKVLAHQRRDAKDSLSKTRENSWFCFHDALIALKERIIAEGLFKELEKDFVNYTVHSSLWNINTLAEPTRTKLIKKMKDEWEEEFGIKGRKTGYFYNKKEYLKYRSIVK